MITERWEKLQGLSLKEGSHSPDSTFCVMEAVAYVAGEPWSDHPACTCPVITAFMVSWNDSLPSDADRDRLLKPLIPLLIGTRNKQLEKKRAIMAADWFIRFHLPAWLRLAGLVEQADRIANFPEITDFAKVPSLQPALEAVRKDSAAAWTAAWTAARAAAWAAAWTAARAAAWAAAWTAAWAAARAAARAAAWDDARDAARATARAAAWDAAWTAAWDDAEARFAPTVTELQLSAVELVKRMCEVKA